MELLTRWDTTIFASLLYLWIGLAYGRAYILSRQPSFMRVGITCLTHIWIVIVFGQFSRLAPLMLTIYPIGILITHLGGIDAIAGYKHPRDLLLFRPPFADIVSLESISRRPPGKNGAKRYEFVLFLINIAGLLSASIYIILL